MNNCLVSICMVTYGHEKFIAQAINSTLIQETNFEFELIIGNDYSPDNTDHIVREIIKNSPNGSKIKYLNHSQNKGMMANFVFVLQQCKGKYIALCDGDDFWTDVNKLQKQVDFLENNPDYALCFHNVIESYEGIDQPYTKVWHEQLIQDTFGTEDVLQAWLIATASIVYRKYDDFVLPDWFSNCSSGDIALSLLLSLKGKFKYMNEVMSVYRKHPSGISNTHFGYHKVIGMTYLYESFNHYTGKKFDPYIKEAIKHEINYHLPELQGLQKRLKFYPIYLRMETILKRIKKAFS